MKTTQEVTEQLGVSRQWLHILVKRHRIKPHKKIVTKRGSAVIRNYYNAEQVKQLRSYIGGKA